MKGGSAEKKRSDASKIIGGVLSLSTAGKKGRHCHRHMIVPSAMVKAADHMKNYVMNVMNTPVHDRLGKKVSVHDRLGA